MSELSTRKFSIYFAWSCIHVNTWESQRHYIITCWRGNVVWMHLNYKFGLFLKLLCTHSTMSVTLTCVTRIITASHFLKPLLPEASEVAHIHQWFPPVGFFHFIYLEPLNLFTIYSLDKKAKILFYSKCGATTHLCFEDWDCGGRYFHLLQVYMLL